MFIDCLHAFIQHIGYGVLLGVFLGSAYVTFRVFYDN